MKNTPLADLLRPKCFDDIVGQSHLFGERGAIRRICESGRLTNMIFYGPPGTGKTTAASIIAAQSGMEFHRLNATTAVNIRKEEMGSHGADIMLRRIAGDNGDFPVSCKVEPYLVERESVADIR